MAPKCPKCQDTGVIVTGNNDLPCTCPAGDTATFNRVSSSGVVELASGAQIKQELAEEE